MNRVEMSEIERIAGIVEPIAEKYSVDRVSLFGSRARGNFDNNSDYDFLISKGEMVSLLSYVAFVDELTEAFGSHVDVVTDTSSDLGLIKSIEKDGILLYERHR